MYCIHNFYSHAYYIHLPVSMFYFHSVYMREGFINLQRAIEEGIIKYFANKAGRAVPDIVLSMRVSTQMFVHIRTCGVFQVPE